MRLDHIEASVLHEFFVYDPETGVLTHKVTRGRAKAGAPAGFKDTRGYLCVKFTYEGKRHMLMAHRVMWAMYHGEFPKGDIDHINRDISDNRLINIRDVSASINVARRQMKIRDLPRGVIWAAHINKTNPYMVQVAWKGRPKYQKYFPIAEAASEDYRREFKAAYGFYPEDL